MIELEMKQRGMYLSRQLSFEDVSFQIDKGVLNPGFIRGFNESVTIFARLLKCFLIQSRKRGKDCRIGYSSTDCGRLGIYFLLKQSVFQRSPLPF